MADRPQAQVTRALTRDHQVRLSSLDAPMEIQKGMVFALETYCPASDGISAARLEEEVVVVDGGVEIITKFPSKELFVTNPY